MAFDISQFHQVFFEETAEHLGNLESLLLGIDRDNPDPEDLNAIFRAAHSIKGSSGTFGFKDLQDVTHILETLLDRVRNGQAPLTEAMVDAFLEAGDVLAAMLAQHRGEGEADPADAERICRRLQALTDGESAAPRAAPAQAPAGAPQPTPAPATDGAERKRLLISFIPATDAPAIVDNVLADLRGWGAVTTLDWGRRVPEGHPWTVEMDCPAAAVECVRDVLEFVAASGSVNLAPLDAPPSLSDAEDGSYGFFDPDPPPAEPAAYGFFDGQPGVPVEPEQEAADGFFGELPGDAPAVKPAGADASHGFFDDAPGAPAAAAVDASATSAVEDARGYGFFTQVPIVPDPAPAAEARGAEVTSLFAAAERKAAARREAAPAKAAPKGDTASIRVGVDKVDQMINLVGELVITQAMLAQAASGVDPVAFERLMSGLAQLERNTRDLQEAVMSIRMMPIQTVFSRFPRVVRDLSQKLGKQVELVMSGEGTELDKGLIERITDPLTHLVRNSLDHGIEMPEARTAKGKPAKGTITLKASHQGGNIVIEVGDDGAGLNRERILAKARERGLPLKDAMSDDEVWLLIFEPGFSTAEQVTEVSGRGVGMDVVKRNITAMGGRIEIQSMTGVGSRMTVRLPLTLAILDGMSVAVGAETFIVPLASVVECLQATPDMIRTVGGNAQLLQVRGEYLPVVQLQEMLGIRPRGRDLDQGIMVVLDADGAKAAMYVDALVGQQQVVIKSLEANYRKVPGISGATIMGDGHVALILDVGAVVASAATALPAAA